MYAHVTDAQDVSQVVEALANGLRSPEDVTRETRLPAYKVRTTLRSMVTARLVIGSLDADGALVFHLSDKGKDMLKGINTARRVSEP
jgi:hypothetical protein